MKTTNLFIDFLVIGFLAVLSVLPFFLEIFIAHPPDWKALAERSAFLLPTITITIYVLGMLFNQASGYVVKLLGVIRLLPSSKKLRDRTFSELDTDYHGAVQLIITKSKEAYAYLSYRRTVIRIYRAILSSMLFLSVSMAIVKINLPLEFGTKSLIIVSCLCVAIFSGFVFAKNLKGYYSSINIFYKQLSEEIKCPLDQQS